MDAYVFKFGGASVNAAAGVRNVGRIVEQYTGKTLVVIVSAMGKTTNALEAILNEYWRKDPIALIERFREFEEYHYKIMHELFPETHDLVYGEVDSLFNQLRGYIRKGHLYTSDRLSYDFEYDQIVSFGELISTVIVHHYLLQSGKKSVWHDARELIRTDDTYRDARVNWEETGANIRNRFNNAGSEQSLNGIIHLTQGFIGSDQKNNTTTLGREGSDFSAAIVAWALGAKEMFIWKDVPGVMNADPKWMPGAIKIDSLSYREAIELAYYGASLIHPKTIKPLENANIRLQVRSFVDPEASGTIVENLREWRIPFPIFIRKTNQVLISLSTRDFSFVLEENLSEIFRVIAMFRIKVNLMQNSAISFSVCMDHDPMKVDPLITYLEKDYEVRYNSGLELITIRHYNEEALNKMIKNRQIMLELRSRNTCQLLLR
jgi:aspartate kinase